MELNLFFNFDIEIFFIDLFGNNFKLLDVINIFFECRLYCNIMLFRCNILFLIVNSLDLLLNKLYGGGEVLLIDFVINSFYLFIYIFGDS